MMRLIGSFLATAGVVLAQTPAVQGLFIAQAAEIARRSTDAEGAKAALQGNLGLSAEGASVVFAIGQEYAQGAEAIEQKVKSSVANRRLAGSPGTPITVSPAMAFVETAFRELNMLAGTKRTELKNRLGVDDYIAVLTYMRANSNMSFLPYRGTTRSLAPLIRTPTQFWLEVVRGPLSGPDADRLFAQNYVSASMPPLGNVPGYMMGTVVAVEPGRVVVSMEQNGHADAALMFDGKDWKLNREPEVGSLVRFTGVVMDWKKDPFLVLFLPERLGGIDAVTPFDRK